MRLIRLFILGILFFCSAAFGSGWVARAQDQGPAQVEPTPRPVMLPTVTPVVAPTLAAPAPATSAPPPAQSNPPAAQATAEPMPQPTSPPASARPITPPQPIQPKPTSGFATSDTPAAKPVAPSSSLPLPSIDDAADETARQIELRFKEASSTASMVVNSAVDTAQRTNPIVLMLVVVVIGILAGVLVVTTGRLLGAVRQTRQATRGWQVQPFATTQRDPAEQTGPMDTGPDVDVLCSLVSDTIGHVVMSKSNDLAHVGDEPAPHIVIEATDGHVYMLTSDVSALRRSRRIVGRARVWRITNPRSFAFTRAQAMWERVRNTYTWQRANTKPLTIWHIVAMQPNAWRPDAGQSSMPQHAI